MLGDKETLLQLKVWQVEKAHYGSSSKKQSARAPDPMNSQFVARITRGRWLRSTVFVRLEGPGPSSGCPQELQTSTGISGKDEQ